MVYKTDWFDQNAVEILRSGGVGVGPTDTVYGVLAVADDEAAIERIYQLKRRDKTKSLIVLVSHIDQLKQFGVTDEGIQQAKHYWPGATTLVLNAPEAPGYLRRDKPSLAIRLPGKKSLRKLISKTGPLVAPSANPEGQSPALSHKQAVNYFGDEVDLYVGDNSPVSASSSSIISLINDQPEQLR